MSPPQTEDPFNCRSPGPRGAGRGLDPMTRVTSESTSQDGASAQFQEGPPRKNTPQGPSGWDGEPPPTEGTLRQEGQTLAALSPVHPESPL